MDGSMPVKSLEIDSNVDRSPDIDHTTKAFTAQVTEKWFKPCVEKIEELHKTTEYKNEKETAVIEKSANIDSLNTEIKIKPIFSPNICKSSAGVCTNTALKNFEFCHKHILEDKTSPYKRCNYVSKEGYQRCTNPAPKIVDKRSYCIHHDSQIEVGKSKPKKKKVKKNPAHETKEKKIMKNDRPGSSNSKRRLESSSSEEEYNFFTDSVQVDKTACTWLGNQGSDADSTDSEDENPLNHAGSLTVEECVRICKEKMSRLRFLYMQQYKRLGYSLKEERRKLLNKYDMDPYVLSKVGHLEKSEDTYADFVEDIHLTNYQKNSGEELIAEKMMREKRNHGHHGKKPDLPRCQHSVDGIRCSFRVIPCSKFCYSHICLDQEQYLFQECKNIEKRNNSRTCQQPSEFFHENCLLHISLESSSTEKAMHVFEIVKKSREARKRRKQEQVKTENKEEKKDIVYHNTRRASLKNKDEGLKSPTEDMSSKDVVISQSVDSKGNYFMGKPAMETKPLETKPLESTTLKEIRNIQETARDNPSNIEITETANNAPFSSITTVIPSSTLNATVISSKVINTTLGPITNTTDGIVSKEKEIDVVETLNCETDIMASSTISTEKQPEKSNAETTISSL